MPRNYDTTAHTPYPRITDISLHYAADGSVAAEYTEVMAVVDGNGAVQHLSNGASRHRLDMDTITEPVQIVHPATGAAIPGQTVTKQQLMLGLLAFLRADQMRRDAAAEFVTQSVIDPIAETEGGG